MSDVLSDGNISVFIAPTTAFASVAAPTTTELNAVGVIDITDRLTPSGLKIGAGNDTVDSSSLAAKFTTNVVGRSNFDPSLTFKFGSTTGDNTWQTPLLPQSYAYLVIRRGIAWGTAFASAQKLEIYKVQAGEWQPSDPEANSLITIMVPLVVSTAPRTIAVPAVVS